MDANEEYVRSRWKNVAFTGGDNQIIPGAGFVSADVMALSNIKSSPEQAWEQAAEFTRQHEEEIRQLREEVALALEMASSPNGMKQIYKSTHHAFSTVYLANRATAARILDRLESALAELLIGWKEHG